MTKWRTGYKYVKLIAIKDSFHVPPKVCPQCGSKVHIGWYFVKTSLYEYQYRCGSLMDNKSINKKSKRISQLQQTDECLRLEKLNKRINSKLKN